MKEFRILSLAFFFAICSLACNDQKEPELNKEEMSDVLLDMMVADEIVRLYPPRERDSIRDVLTQSLLKIHDIDRSELDSNLYLYMRDFESFGQTIELTTLKTKALQKDDSTKE